MIFSRPNQEERTNINRPVTSTVVETDLNFQQTKVQKHMASKVNSIKRLRSVNTYTFETIPKNGRGRNIPKYILSPPSL